MPSIRPTIRRNFGKIVFEGPYDQQWVLAIKNAIPSRERELSQGRVWLFDPRYYGAVVAITQHYYGSSALDSTGGVAEPQRTDWQERWEAWRSTESHRYKNRNTYDRSRERVQSKPSAFDPHAILYVTSEAPPEVIKAAYRVLALMHHPDKGGDAERMKLINAAFDMLKNQGAVT